MANEKLDSTADTESEELERYGTREAWSREFKISSMTVVKRLRDIQGITGKDCSGQVLQNGFYAESIVRLACADILQDVPMADNAGFFLLNAGTDKQVRYGHIHAWSRDLGISDPTLKKRLRDAPGITGKDHGGRVIENGYYPESLVRKVCADLLQEVPRASKDGFFVLGQERYGTVGAWARKLQEGYAAIKRRLKGVRGITAKDPMGRPMESAYYAESGK